MAFDVGRSNLVHERLAENRCLRDFDSLAVRARSVIHNLNELGTVDLSTECHFDGVVVGPPRVGVDLGQSDNSTAKIR